MSLETKIERTLRSLAKSRPVTVDDVQDTIIAQGSRAKKLTYRILRRPRWRAVTWVRTEKQSRHGRPIRGWKPAEA